MKLYQSIAEKIRERIEQGYYQVNEKLPSIRTLSQEHDVSVSTAQQALLFLEKEHWIEVRAKSGSYVKAQLAAAEMPQPCRPAQYPLKVSQWKEVRALRSLYKGHSDDFLYLSSGMSDIDAPTLKPLLKIMSHLTIREGVRCLTPDTLQGAVELREQIARLALDGGTRLHPDDIITTTGCQEALAISLQALTKAGDVVAVESPGFYGLMQILKALDLQALEIPAHADDGMSLDALEMALDQWPIKAILVIPTENNPLGSTMPDENKVRLLKMTQRYNTPIIEDDIYGDLRYKQPRPRTLHSFDTEGRVILCSSFSKTMSAALRIGWVAPGRYKERIEHMKYIGTANTTTLTQLAIAEFIKQGYYERHVRTVRQQYRLNRDQLTHMLQTYFPKGTRISAPRGAYILWIELPGDVDTLLLNKRLVQHKIQIAPGVIFSASGKYRNCLRINYARPVPKSAVLAISQEAKELLAESLMPQ
ncbi:PLP-dependent aminotransferase family protein [Leucothrix arctica]|uniref:GntR family transcriptional regulator n=1 Tax=Leucothrix arctica TaxID=1481894 RepID=A0A317CH82_9GAMM|nr:PLP-dependent aminotransferase family protein [Leucothrix arctica]PWQ97905.1 GntR family transcriptional regulator [Leucothrix arctica]